MQVSAVCSSLLIVQLLNAVLSGVLGLLQGGNSRLVRRGRLSFPQDSLHLFCLFTQACAIHAAQFRALLRAGAVNYFSTVLTRTCAATVCSGETHRQNNRAR